MIKLILIVLLFIASLVIFFPVPAKEVWYVGIAVPEFPLLFLGICLGLIIWSIFSKKYKILSLALSVITFIILCFPIAGAMQISNSLQANFEKVFPNRHTVNFIKQEPFSISGMVVHPHIEDLPFTSYIFAKKDTNYLSLNFTKAKQGGKRPCLIEIHGGAWRRGDVSELAHFNNYMANAGYHVATLSYRLAPQYHSPAQEEDIHDGIQWLRNHADSLGIDTSNFVISGRSAGAHLALCAAYNGKESGIKGVAAYYGPTEMFWTYVHPDNPLIMDSREVVRDFLGGTPEQAKAQYASQSPMLLAPLHAVPTLLIHGRSDAHVYYEQSLRQHLQLDELKVPNYLLTLPWATHGCEFNLYGPSGQLSMYCTERFFASVTGQ